MENDPKQTLDPESDNKARGLIETFDRITEAREVVNMLEGGVDEKLLFEVVRGLYEGKVVRRYYDKNDDIWKVSKVTQVKYHPGFNQGCCIEVVAVGNSICLDDEDYGFTFKRVKRKVVTPAYGYRDHNIRFWLTSKLVPHGSYEVLEGKEWTGLIRRVNKLDRALKDGRGEYIHFLDNVHFVKDGKVALGLVNGFDEASGEFMVLEQELNEYGCQTQREMTGADLVVVAPTEF